METTQTQVHPMIQQFQQSFEQVARQQQQALNTWQQSVNQFGQLFQVPAPQAGAAGQKAEAESPQPQSPLQAMQRQAQQWVTFQQEKTQEFFNLVHQQTSDDQWQNWLNNLQPDQWSKTMQEMIEFQQSAFQQLNQTAQGFLQSIAAGQPNAQPLFEQWMALQNLQQPHFQSLVQGFFQGEQLDKLRNRMMEWQQWQQTVAEQYRQLLQQHSGQLQQAWLSGSQPQATANPMQQWQQQAQQGFEQWMKAFQPQAAANPMQQWQQQAQQGFEQWMKAFQPQATANPMQQWQQQAQQGFEQWMKAFQPQAAANPMQQWQELMGLRNMQDLPQRIGTAWQQALQRNMQAFQQSQAQFGQLSELMNSYERWNHLFQQSLNAFSSLGEKNYGNLFGQHQERILQDAYKSLNDTIQNYTRIYEALQPAWQAIQDRTFQVLNPSAYLSTKDYDKVINQLFNFVSPQSFLELQEMLQAIARRYGHSQEQTLEKYSQTLQKNMELMNEAARGDGSALVKMMHNNLTTFQNTTTDPFFKINTEGKWDDIAQHLYKVSNKLATYSVRTAEYQQAMTRAGYQAYEQVVEKMADLVKAGQEPKSFNDLFRLWVDTNDQVFVNMFRTEEFAQVQAEMIDLGMEIKIDLQNVMELVLSDFPIATRSEVQNLSKTIHHLTNRVRDLESELEHYTESAATQPTPAKAATTKKAATAKTSKDEEAAG